MKPPLNKVLNKPRFIVDINISVKLLNKEYGGFANFKSTVFLTKNQESSDDDIIKTANSKNYHIITHNTKHFIEAPKKFLSLKIGIICINLKEGNFIDKLGKLLRDYKKHDNFCNKLITLGNEIQIETYSDLRE